MEHEDWSRYFEGVRALPCWEMESCQRCNYTSDLRRLFSRNLEFHKRSIFFVGLQQVCAWHIQRRNGCHQRDHLFCLSVGTYQPIPGASNHTLCIPCAVGNFSKTQGVAVCQQCPFGSYGDAFGLTECVKCPKGTWTRAVGSIRADQCSSWVKRPEDK